MKRQLLIIAISLSLCGMIQAQEAKQYFHILGGIGVHDLSTDFANSMNTNKGKVGYQINAGYSYFFNSHWGGQIGLGVQYFNSTSTLNFIDSVSNLIDSDGDKYKLYMKFNNWIEKKQCLLLDVPLSLLYRSSINRKMSLLVSGGVKISFPIITSSNLSGGNIVTSGYYPDYDLTISDMGSDGFPVITDNTDTYYYLKKDTDFSLKPTYMLLFDLGIMRGLTRSIDYYIGGYVNYGLNNIRKNTNKSILVYEGYNSNLSKFLFDYNGSASTVQTDKILPVSFGLKLGLYFKSGRKVTKVIEKKKQEKQEIITDTDGDGVPDYLDKCPGTPKEAIGFVDNNGCPLDADVDGISDYLDKCPGTPLEARGFVDTNGCPLDTDGDGVPDYLDKCPGTLAEARGKVNNNGCPLDTDGDGIADYLDKCPTIPGAIANNGCPEIKQEVKILFKKALQGIQFQTAKYDIKPISFKLLNDIAIALINNPTYLIEIQGHTDNVGRPDANLILSEKRALAVKVYLTSKGVDEKRMTSRGYGDGVPVSDNNTVTGRMQNRRVEFIVSFEKLSEK